jgi:hypothetical protein
MQNEVSYWIPDLNATKKIVDSMKRPTVKEVADGEGTEYWELILPKFPLMKQWKILPII